MNTAELLEKYKPLLKRHWPPLLLGLLGLIFLGYGLIGLLTGSGKSQDVGLQQSKDLNLDSQVSPAASGTDIIIDIEGAVLKPGVYSLNQDARLKEALIAAGGLSREADRIWIAKNLNLAMKLTDGTKVYIPSAGESASLGRGTETSGDLLSRGLININSASAAELDKLPGVGPATARKIIDGRPYSSIDELIGKKIMSQKAFDKIKDRISVF
ncbi:ComEA family DNA-binding protein [Patescibacteria group bacterium]|nr:ComEA family DNA-binding protein [Patescibacteria group bacterium]MCL5010401.1 ComEA family DNA-binding protein [Patescibacteria group bacterium]